MVESLLGIYIDLIAKMLRSLRVSVGVSGLSISIQTEAEQTLDQRVAKLDAARANFVEGIKEIDQLKHEAEKNRKEIAGAVQQISQLEADKKNLAEELNAIQAVVNADVEAFRRVAGVPAASDIRRERIIGFVSGVLASVIASGVVYLVAKAAQYVWPNQ